MVVCNICNLREAKLHITDVDKTTGAITPLDICLECAIRTGLLPQSGPVALGSLLSTPIKSIIQADAETPDPAQDEAAQSGPAESSDSDAPAPCPGCGITWEEVQSHVRFGCDRDYDHFHEQVDVLLQRLHGGATRHTGKVPANLGQMRARRDEVQRLNGELEDAIVIENYEEAARLRDRIRELEQH
ncbi:MAG: UvrB/UvrC motif-containing protein [Planctomycetota bacterium]